MKDAALSQSLVQDKNTQNAQGKPKEKSNVLAFLHKDQSVTAKELYEFLPAAIEVEQTPSEA